LCVLAAQEIIVSKDSLKVCNSLGSSVNDSIVFTNTASSARFLDSARMVFYELDTAGLFLQTVPGLQINLSEHGHDGSIGWIANLTDRIGNNEYLARFSPWTSSRNPPFYMSTSGDSTALELTIANCLMCDIPIFPRYSEELLQMYFSNGQTVSLNFYSDDLRPSTVKQTFPVRRYAKATGNGADYMINGRKIPAHTGRMNRHLIRYRIHKK
jgi:hypothetical protein